MGVLEKLHISKRAFTGLIVAGFMAILIGAVLLVISFVVINAVVTGMLTNGNSVGTYNSSFNTSFWATYAIIQQALGISGIALIIVGIAIIISVLLGLVGGGGGRR